MNYDEGNDADEHPEGDEIKRMFDETILSAPRPDPRVRRDAMLRAADEIVTAYWRIGADASTLGVIRACETYGMDRGRYIRLRRAYAQGGRLGLTEAVSRSIRFELREALHDAIRQKSLQHPTWGRDRIIEALRAEGVDVPQGQVRRVLRRMKG